MQSTEFNQNRMYGAKMNAKYNILVCRSKLMTHIKVQQIRKFLPTQISADNRFCQSQKGPVSKAKRIQTGCYAAMHLEKLALIEVSVKALSLYLANIGVFLQIIYQKLL